MAYLFMFMAAGYALIKLKAVPDSSAGVLSKLELVLLIPCLVFSAFSESFTTESLVPAARLITACVVMLVITVPVSFFIGRRLSGEGFTRRIITYALMMPNYGYMGRAVVQAIFPEIFAEYLQFCIPADILLYGWAIPVLLSVKEESAKRGVKDILKGSLNAITVGMVLGMAAGLTGLKLPAFIKTAVGTCGDFSSPIAMLLTGMCFAQMDLKSCFSDKRVYLVTALRLAVFPLIAFGICRVLSVERTAAMCLVLFIANPGGLSEVTVPKAYGVDTPEGIGIVFSSHILGCITIPLVCMLLTV